MTPFFDVEGQLAGALLGRAPADAMGQAGDVFDLFGFDPLALFRDGGRIMFCAFFYAKHLFHFTGILHTVISSFA